MSEGQLPSVDSELKVARSTLAAARLLAREGYHRDAVTRAYYALYHAASALLGSTGRSARMHEGLRAQINEHFVRTGKLAPEHARALRRTAGDRNDADYDAAAVFSEADSTADIAAAEAFIAAVEELLLSPVGP